MSFSPPADLGPEIVGCQSKFTLRESYHWSWLYLQPTSSKVLIFQKCNFYPFRRVMLLVRLDLRCCLGLKSVRVQNLNFFTCGFCWFSRNWIWHSIIVFLKDILVRWLSSNWNRNRNCLVIYLLSWNWKVICFVLGTVKDMHIVYSL